MCNYCGKEHATEVLCQGVTRRKFFFLGGGVLGAILAAPAVMWEPYRNGGWERYHKGGPLVSIVSYDKNLLDRMEMKDCIEHEEPGLLITRTLTETLIERVPHWYAPPR